MHFGHKIAIGFCSFALMMGVLVYKSMQTDFELVSKEYYKDELNYQQVIDATEKARQLNGNISISVTDNTIELRLPEEMNGKAINGEVFFYCAANGKNDRRFAIHQHMETIEKKKVPGAAYTAKISWQANGSNYYHEQQVIIP